MRADLLAQAREAAEKRRDELCDMYVAAFSTPAGQRVLLDLEALVMTPALLPTATEAELRDHMGQKRLFGIIMERIEHGRRKRAEHGSAGGDAGQQQPARTGRAARAVRRRAGGA